MLHILIDWVAEKLVNKYYKPKIPALKKSINIEGIDVAIGELSEHVGKTIVNKYLLKKLDVEKYIDGTVFKPIRPYSESIIYLDIESDSKYNVLYSWGNYIVHVDFDNDVIIDIFGGD